MKIKKEHIKFIPRERGVLDRAGIAVGLIIDRALAVLCFLTDLIPNLAIAAIFLLLAYFFIIK
jgi:hypothetical protein